MDNYQHGNNNRVRNFKKIRAYCQRCKKTTQHQMSILMAWRCVECGERYTPMGR